MDESIILMGYPVGRVFKIHNFVLHDFDDFDVDKGHVDTSIVCNT